jgi:hypothetical protein
MNHFSRSFIEQVSTVARCIKMPLEKGLTMHSSYPDLNSFSCTLLGVKYQHVNFVFVNYHTGLQ